MQGISHINNGVRCLRPQCFNTASSQFHCGRKISKHIFSKNNERKNTCLPKSSGYDSADSHLKKINERKSDNRDNKSGWSYSTAVATGAIGYSLYKCFLDAEKTEKDTQPDPLEITVSVYPIGYPIGEPGKGSGFYFDDKGHILTCAHVVPTGTFWYCTSLSNSGIYTVGARDDKTDIAVLNPVYRTKQPGSIESHGYQIAEPATSFFKPTDLSAYDYTTGEFITSRQRFGGVITPSINRPAIYNFFAYRAKSGFSGGLVTSKGYFEGMLMEIRFENKSKLQIAESFVPAKIVDYCAKSLIEYGKVVHYKLGIELKEEKKELKVISSENKKILANDKVLALNGMKVASVKDFAQALPEIELLVTSSSEKELVLLLEREGVVQTVSLPIPWSEKNWHDSFKHGCF